MLCPFSWLGRAYHEIYEKMHLCSATLWGRFVVDRTYYIYCCHKQQLGLKIVLGEHFRAYPLYLISKTVCMPPPIAKICYHFTIIDLEWGQKQSIEENQFVFRVFLFYHSLYCNTSAAMQCTTIYNFRFCLVDKQIRIKIICVLQATNRVIWLWDILLNSVQRSWLKNIKCTWGKSGVSHHGL